MIKEWPKNDYSLESSLMIGLPEELGIIEQVRVHIKLENGTYIPVNATYLFSSELKEKPIIFQEDTKDLVKLTGNNFAIFGIIYQIIDENYFSGSFCITFASWKDEKLNHYYTEEKNFNII